MKTNTVFLHSFNLIKFLVEHGVVVHMDNTLYNVVKSCTCGFIVYCPATEFSGGKIELYKEYLKENKFFVYLNACNESYFKGKTICLFNKEKYNEEEINSISNNRLLDMANNDFDNVITFDNIQQFIIETNESYFNNIDDYIIKLI